jgi:hypothetical protein
MKNKQAPKRGKSFRQNATKANRLWQDTWAPEVLNCIVAFSALIGMAIMLKLRQGTQSDDWLLFLFSSMVVQSSTFL